MTTLNEAYEVYWTRLQESARYHPANRFRYALIFSRLKCILKPGMSVLDMGCGDARLIRRLQSAWPQNVFAGCDISQQIIRYNSDEHPGIGFFQADVSSRDFLEKAFACQANGFDVVISSEVIEHVENDAGLLQNAARILAPGGYLVLTTQSGPRYRVDKELLHHLRHYRRADLETMVRREGLEIVDSFNCGFPVLTLQKMIANAMFDTVMRSAAASTKPPAPVRAVMSVMYVLMRVAPKLSGPQIVLVARRAVASQGRGQNEG